MKKSWTSFFRRMAAACAFSGTIAWSSAMCYAQVAYDDASDPVYNDGWQAGDNGGYGFTAWNFDSSLVNYPGGGYYTSTAFHAIDDGLQNGTHYSNQYNNIGRAWDIGRAAGSDGAPRAGRGFSPLQIGQTLRIVIDNPTEEMFFKGYFIDLSGNTGGMDGNICYQGTGCSPGAVPVRKMRFQEFDYFTYGEWKVVDGGVASTGVFDTDTAAAGAAFSVTRTGDETYDVLMQSLGGGPSFSASRTFDSAGIVPDWIGIEFFNTTTDTATPPTKATDLYIRSMEIFEAAPAGLLGDYNEDDVIDAADYAVWRDALTAGATMLANDPTPGVVNESDFTYWRNHYGETAGGGSGSGSLSAAAVPEPSTFVYLVAGFGGLVGCRWRRGT
jgi:PEP-CTERM motif